MIAVIQRVSRASVSVDGEIKGKCEKGLLVLAAVTVGDSEEDMTVLSEKISKLRIFSDENGKLNYSVKDVDGGILAVSNFTIAGSCKKGNRPDFGNSAPYAEAQRLFDRFTEILREKVGKVECGVFGADMEVSLLNDGPLTVILDSRELRPKNVKN